jgi:hypothetical protein
MKSLSIFFFCSLICGLAAGQSAAPQLQVHSSNPRVEAIYKWARQKALTHVVTGKTGVINKSEQSAGDNGHDYAPGYWAGYPYRSAYYSRDFCHQAIGAHLLGLDTENFTMMKAFAASANAKQQWFPVWALNFDGSIYTLDYHSPSDFVREVPAVFELVEKAWALYRWTGDERYINDPVIWNYCSKAVSDFVQLHDHEMPNGVAEGTGTGNIFLGTATYNESVDVPALEAGDGIASQFAAFRAYAGMAAVRGEEDLADRFLGKADELKRFYTTQWSVLPGNAGVTRLYNKDKKAVGGWGKENSWFMPMKGIMDRSPATLDYLGFIDRSARSKQGRPSNIEATTYLPETFFRYHLDEKGWQWILDVMDSAQVGSKGDYPEVSFVLVSNIVQDLMGLHPDAGAGTISTCSHLPEAVPDLQIDNLIFGSYRISVQHIGRNKTIFTNLSGSKSLVWSAHFQGLHPTVKVNGKIVLGSLIDDRGLRMTAVDLTVQPGEKIEVVTE